MKSPAEKFFTALLAKVNKLKEGTSGARKQSKEMCTKEISATKEFKEGLAYASREGRRGFLPRVTGFETQVITMPLSSNKARIRTLW